MQRIDGAYLYSVATQLRDLATINEKDQILFDIYIDLWRAKTVLRTFLYDSVFKDVWRAVRAPAEDLLRMIDKYVPEPGNSVDFDRKIEAHNISAIKTTFKRFEDVMTAELQVSPLYYVSPKGGFDTVCLTDNGEALFPKDLARKVPAAIPDVRAAMRCLGFELPTAAGFHLHRANEAVLRKYFDCEAGEQNRPSTRNMGDYLRRLNELQKGDQRVKDVLKGLKDLHRNPLMHPEETLDTIDDAISLYAAIRAAIGYMLDRIPIMDSESTLSLGTPPSIVQ